MTGPTTTPGPTERVCWNCAHSRGPLGGAWLAGVNGRCVYDPPKLVQFGGGEHLRYLTEWPEVEPQMGCRQFEPRPAGGAE